MRMDEGKREKEEGRGIGGLVIALLLAVGVAPELFAQSDSLWGGSTASLYDEQKAVSPKIHEHVQIIVLEKSKGGAGADLRADKRTRWNSAVNDWIKFQTSGKGRVVEAADAERLDPEIDLDSRLRTDNSAKTTRMFELSFTITAEVVDVRPNGVLVLEAKKERTVNDETESVTLTGECNPASIIGGSIRSDLVANMKVTLKGSGSVNDGQKQGFLSWVLGKLWPF